jgi:hypothetical protein
VDQFVGLILLNVAVGTQAEGVKAVVTWELAIEVVGNFCAVVEASGEVKGAAGTCRSGEFGVYLFTCCLGLANSHFAT